MYRGRLFTSEDLFTLMRVAQIQGWCQGNACRRPHWSPEKCLAEFESRNAARREFVLPADGASVAFTEGELGELVGYAVQRGLLEEGAGDPHYEPEEIFEQWLADRAEKARGESAKSGLVERLLVEEPVSVVDAERDGWDDESVYGKSGE